MKQSKIILIFILLYLPILLSAQGIGYRFFDKEKSESEAPIDMTYERVFVHTDRDLYVSGEKMLFSFYLIDSLEYGSSQKSIVGYLELINSENTPVSQSRFGIYNGYSFGSLSIPDSIASGEYLVRAYTRHMRNKSPDLFYTQAIAIYNPFKENSEIKIDKGRTDDKAVINQALRNINISGSAAKTFRTREKVRLKFQLDTASFINPEHINISISISVPPALEEKISIGQFLSENSRSRFAPGQSSNSQGNSIGYREIIGPYIEGSVISREPHQPTYGQRLYLSLPGKSTSLQYSITDNNGLFRFILPPATGNQELIIQPSDFSDSFIIKTSTPFANNLNYEIGGKINWNTGFLDYASRLGVNYQVNKIYKLSPSILEHKEKQEKEAQGFYGIPDIQVILNDYIDLPTMEEVFHELVPGVALRKQGEGSGFLFLNEVTGERRSVPGAVFLDGVVVDDPSFIAGIDPELIERIDIIKREYQLGDLVLNGLVNIVSIDGEMCGVEYPNVGLRTATTILNERHLPQNFLFSDTIPENTRLPDFRNTLYWNPLIKPEEDGSFELTLYTSDFLSDYSIIIQGITDTGNQIFHSSTFKVIGK